MLHIIICYRGKILRRKKDREEPKVRMISDIGLVFVVVPGVSNVLIILNQRINNIKSIAIIIYTRKLN